MRYTHAVHIDPAQCVGCGLCRKDCPVNNIAMADRKATILAPDCLFCGHCLAICPKAAVSMTGFDDQPVEIDAPTVLSSDQLLSAIRARRSMRHFLQRPIEPSVLDRIIEAGRLTPTGGNTQDVSYILLQDRTEACEEAAVRLFKRLLPLVKLFSPVAKRAVIDAHFFFKQAPAVLLVVSRNPVNGALAAGNMALMAEACGLGVLYSGFFSMAANHSRRLRSLCGLRRGERVVTTLVLGYPGVTYSRTAPKEPASVRRL